MGSAISSMVSQNLISQKPEVRYPSSITRRLNVGYVGYRRNGYRRNGYTSVIRRLHVRYVGYDLDILAARVFGK